MKTFLTLIMVMLLGLTMAWGQDYEKDIKCKDVPDSIVVSGKLWWGALILYDEWYNPYVAQEEVPCNCPEGTRAMWRGMGINASNPASRWYDCWSIKTVCDTVWADKINVWLTPDEYKILKNMIFRQMNPDIRVNYREHETFEDVETIY